MPHRAWLIDLDGTLYRPMPVKLLMAAEISTAGIGVLSVISRFRAEHERVRELDDQGGDPFTTQLERTASALGQDVERVQSLVLRWMVERPGRWIRRFRRRSLLEEVARFRAGGGRTALVSDYPALMKLEALDARSLFEEVVASGEPGGPPRLKPAPDGYLLAAERLGVEPAHCLVIGDGQRTDGQAAAAAGMKFRLMR